MEVSGLAAIGSGWLTLVLIFAAGAVPIGHRLWKRRRTSAGSRTISVHMVLGAATAMIAFFHGLLALMSLGSSSAIAGGNSALAAGAAALLVLMAHIGIGLRLRDPKLRERSQVRNKHIATALTITSLALAHAIMLWTAA